MGIFIHKNNEQLGPYEETEIKNFILEGRVSGEDLGWKEGMSDWKPLKELVIAPPPLGNRPPKIQIKEDVDLWTGHPSLMTYGTAWIVVLLTIWFGVGLLIVIWIFWDKFANSYTITNKNLILTKGLIIKSTSQIRIKDIRSINVIKKGLDGLLGIGTVEVSSSASDKAEVIFKGLRNADYVKKIIIQEQEKVD
jgi:membrane protein YdbS with pleckstrin-like domain